MHFIEPLPTADVKQLIPAWIQRLYSAFSGAAAEKIDSDVDWIMTEYQMVVSGSDASFIGCKSIGDDLKLPHELPDSQAASHMDYVPLGDVGGGIARIFADDGWKQASGSDQSGIYELRKADRQGSGGAK